MWAAAARRIAILFGAALAVVAAVSLVLGLLLGASPGRAVSLGFYLAGCFCIVVGFFVGIRGPVRLRGKPGDEGPWGLGKKGGVRLATLDERREGLANTALFLALGLVLIVAGVASDPRYELY
jgi:hypothetical protein